MRSRRDHTRSLLRDAHVLQVMGVSALACVSTGGLLYAYYFTRVWRTAARAPVSPPPASCLLVFGKHSPDGEIDGDFTARLDRAATLLGTDTSQAVLLLGGGPAGVPSEAEVAHRALLARGVSVDGRFHLEHASRDTLQNLRNARDLMRAKGFDATVTLLSSRYHLARCLQFARQLGLRAQVCAAEPAFKWTWTNVRNVSAEAVYMCVSDVGTRWARLIGARKMLSRVT